MTISFTPITSTVGVRVEGCDLGKPLDEETVTTLRQKMHQHGLLLFKHQDITDQDQLRFAKYFGNISKQGPIQKTAPEVTYVSNTRSDGTFGKGELSFHSDQCYYQHPMKAIMLYGLDIPKVGGETLFVNVAEVVASMPEEMKKDLASRKVRHEFDYGMLDYGDEMKKTVKAVVVSAEHPIIAKHPWSDKLTLMSNSNTAKCIVGVEADESQKILDMLDKIVSNPQNVYAHKWEKMDLIVWDNLLLQHARSNFDAAETRTLRRCAIGNENESISV
ncbi:MAG: TauD/TfdA family dioxygenase [Polaromonas sp.]|uniref:TauD/TfdA dioxygenase family protein n=1 Tax=Polaromonas sp. TaxID=1869339 RepID=UPI0025DB866B|nr:TauD/TfdA family dioxygenase [Polaromonas sp.]MBI2726282.1 TauD/TfdA family dioxygenase [Polaromonas sp.]